jgi:hypothetical protein
LRELKLVARDHIRAPWVADLHDAMPATFPHLRSLDIDSYTHQRWDRIMVHLAPLCPNLQHVRVRAAFLGEASGVIPPGSAPVQVEALTVSSTLSPWGYDSFLFNFLRTSLLRPRQLSVYPLGCNSLSEHPSDSRSLLCDSADLERKVVYVSDYLRASPTTSRLRCVRLLPPPTWLGADRELALNLLQSLKRKIQSETEWDVGIGA